MSEVPPLDPSIISTTQSLLSFIIKPKLTDKYLSRPPLRFIIDIIKSCIEIKKYPFQLYTNEYLSSLDNKEISKEVKLEFLDRLISYVSITNKKIVDVKSNKIISGLEPENTNLLLQELGKAIILYENGQVNNEEVIKRVNNGEMMYDSKNDIQSTATTSNKSNSNAPIQQPSQPEPPSSAPSESTLDIVLASNPPDCPNYIIATQKALQPFFDKPKLTAKAVGKPPFAFLYDVVRAIMKSTGFFEGLFTEAELNKETLTESKAKAAFLKKAFDCISIVTKRPIAASISKILGGLEPENTNEMFLQLAEAAGSGINFASVLQQYNNPQQDPIPARPGTSKSNTKPEVSAPIKFKEEPKPIVKEPVREHVREREMPTEEVIARVDDDENKVFERPKTAKRAPPKVKTNIDEKPVEKTEEPISRGVLLDTDVAGEDDEEIETREERNDDEDIGSGGGKLKREIAKNLADKKSVKKNEAPSINANGSIVFANRLGSAKVDKTGKSAVEQKKMNEQLRDWIQQLCQSVTPLGKCVEFVHEDIEIMSRELSRWQREYQSQIELLSQEQKKTDETLAPLRRQLEDLERTSNDQISQLQFLNASILRNETQMRQTLDLQSQGLKL